MSKTTFSKCPNPNCEAITSGDSIYKCDKCGKLYCHKVCMPPYNCGGCNASWTDWTGLFPKFSTVGYIN